MISILCPTRKRPYQLMRMVESVRDTISHPNAAEIILYIDEDDTVSRLLVDFITHIHSQVRAVIGPRIILTDTWNKCLPEAQGGFFMQGNDDMILRTKDWDKMVEKAYREGPGDRIHLVFGSDAGLSDPGMHNGNFGPHAIVSREWVDVIGYFIPPYFESEYGDWWINDVARGISTRECPRWSYLPFICEHMHYEIKDKQGVPKARYDSTYAERIERHRIQDPGKIWNDTLHLRQQDMEKLRLAINKWNEKRLAQIAREAQGI